MSTPNRSKEARRRRRLAARAARERISWTATVPVELNIQVGGPDPINYPCPDPECRAPAGTPCTPTPLADNRPGAPNKENQ